MTQPPREPGESVERLEKANRAAYYEQDAPYTEEELAYLDAKAAAEREEAMTERLPIELSYKDSKLVIQAFALSDERYAKRAGATEIRNREALLCRFEKLQDALERPITP